MVIFLIPALGHDKNLFNDFKSDEKLELVYLEYPLNELDNQKDYLEYCANYFAQLIKVLNPNDFMLAGVSLGASLCLRINQILSNKAHSLILMAPGGTKVARIRKEMIEDAANKLNDEDFLNKILNLDSEEEFLSHFSKNTEEAKNYYKHLTNSWNQVSASQYAQFKKLSLAATNIDYEDQLKRFQFKTIILWGEKDKVFSKKNLEKLKEVAPNATYILYPEFGHYLPIEAPEEFLQVARKQYA